MTFHDDDNPEVQRRRQEEWLVREEKAREEDRRGMTVVVWLVLACLLALFLFTGYGLAELFRQLGIFPADGGLP